MTTLPSPPAFTSTVFKSDEPRDFASRLAPEVHAAKYRAFNSALSSALRLVESPAAADIQIAQLAKSLGVGGKKAQSTALLSEELTKINCTASTLTPFDLQIILGKSDGNSSEYTAMAMGNFSAACVIASKVANGTAANHSYLYSRFDDEIKTAFVNGQTVFAISSFPSVNVGSVVYSVAQEYHNAGFELIHLDEEQSAKHGFELGVTAEQFQAFVSKAPSLKAMEFEVAGRMVGPSLFNKAALNQLYCLNAFVQYVAKWEKLNRDAFEALESADEQDCEAIAEPAPEVETTPKQATEVESSEPTDTPETTDVQDCISGPTESSGSALAPAGATALALPATAPIFVPEAAITVNKSAPSFFRDVNAGLCKAVPKFSTDEPETTANGPLVPVCGDTNHVSFDYCGHHYELEYSDEGWRWTFDDFKDQEGRGFLFKAEGMTLTEMAKRIDLDARYLGELVFHIEQALEIKLGKFENPSFEFVTIDYSLGYELRDLPTFSLLGAKVYLPLRTRKGRIEFCSDLAIAEWRMDVAAFGAMMLNRAGFIPSDAANFMKGWITSALWCIEDEVQLRAFENDLADEVPF